MGSELYGVELKGVELPNRGGGSLYARKALIALDQRGSRLDEPVALLLSEIEETPNLFQPRLNSIAYAPGRSEAHIVGLTKTTRRGHPLDPLWVLAFGNEWHLIDGHHRLQAYRAAGWKGTVPVKALLTELRGNDRIDWGVQMSFAENKKDRLTLSSTDKSDGAWRAVVGGNLSKAETAKEYDVGESTVASMRRVHSALLDLQCPVRHMMSLGWQGAKAELRRREDGLGKDNHVEFDDRRRKDLAKRLRGPMDLKPSAAQLAEALEAYSPGIVTAMAFALDAEQRGDD